MPDASANPYTAVAAVLQAARLGYEEKYPLPAHEEGDCFERTDAGHGTAASLAGAMEDLEADKALMAAVGRELCEHHLFMKRAEVDKTRALEGDGLRDFYIWYV
jgi:glutamine synthetase